MPTAMTRTPSDDTDERSAIRADSDTTPIPRGGTRPLPAETPDPPEEALGGLGLTSHQVAGSALAAGTSAVAASFLGVAGTIIGAVLGSLIATVGGAVYAKSLGRAGEQIRGLRGRPPGVPTTVIPDEPAPDGVTRAAPAEGPRPSTTSSIMSSSRFSVRHVALVGLLGVVLALAGVTALESVLGHPLSSSASSGTSIGTAVGGGSDEPSSSPSAPASTVSVSTSAKPSASQAPTPTAPISPSVQPSASPSAPASTPPASPSAEPPAPSDEAPRAVSPTPAPSP